MERAVGLHDFRAERDELLRPAFSARHDRGGLLSWHRAVSDVPVSDHAPGPHYFALHGGDSHFGLDRWSALRMGTRYASWHSRPGRLAVAVSIEGVATVVFGGLALVFLIYKLVETSEIEFLSGPWLPPENNQVLLAALGRPFFFPCRYTTAERLTDTSPHGKAKQIISS
jgi:hypothetical protein